ncbi:DUF2520 domain-containing protein [Dysgonomonas sp. Marseille-P4677]|uniref:Rossmann-like and DUF2520 domain-containing protein n=1 Tax=Dysgonomonas sp. Marseille-P4677 TaxID=2364790 RepID=UPI001913948A|nr:F420-dependent NADP oxidoreductase [Dysgonomonas sp. Marseille-P4677]MBK5721237.1 DUF2520 domain-containing protein [Dysgonomonas sp. Marseille-P4677]
MKIVFIGAGNVAVHLATELYKYGFNIIQVYSRSFESATWLANQVEAQPVTNIEDIVSDADIYIFCLKDSVLEDIISQLHPNKGLWIHTSGSIPMSVFEKYNAAYGVIYPFQTFSKNRVLDWKTTPIFIEASDNKSLQTLDSISKQLSDKVSILSSTDRRYIHLTGVFACNFTNHMYSLAEHFLKKIDLPFNVALPLIDETASKVHELTPDEAQTGPAVRFDENIINKHLEMIEDDRIKEIYKLISENIHNTKTN